MMSMTINRKGGYSGRERNSALQGVCDFLQCPTIIGGSTYHPAWGAGTLASDVVAGAPILAGTAQLTVSPMAPRRAQFLAATWRSRRVRCGSIQIRWQGPSAASPNTPGLPRN